VRVAGDQFDPGQATGHQAAEEGQPAGAVLGGGAVQTEDLPVPVGVHPGRQQGVDPYHPAALRTLEHQGIGGDEGARALIQRAGSERLDMLVQILRHYRDMGLGQRWHAQ
jgi:hypothetical protein